MSISKTPLTSLRLKLKSLGIKFFAKLELVNRSTDHQLSRDPTSPLQSWEINHHLSRDPTPSLQTGEIDHDLFKGFNTASQHHWWSPAWSKSQVEKGTPLGYPKFTRLPVASSLTNKFQFSLCVNTFFCTLRAKYNPSASSPSVYSYTLPLVH